MSAVSSPGIGLVKSFFLVLSTFVISVISVTKYGTIAIVGVLILFALFALRKRLPYWWVLLPFALFSFVPFDYATQLGVKVFSLGKLNPPMALIFAQVVLYLVFNAQKLNINSMKKNKWVFVSLLLFFISSVISWLIQQDGITQLKYISTTFILSFGTLFLILSSNAVKVGLMIPRAIALISLVVAVVGLLEFFIGFQPYESAYVTQALQDGTPYWYVNNMSGIISHGALKRIVSTIGNPLVLGYYLLTCMPLVMLLREKSSTKWFWSLVLVVDLFAVICTQDRTALLGIVLVLYFYAFQRGLRRVITITLFLGALSLFTWAVLNAFGVWQFFTQRIFFHTAGASYSNRTAAFGWAYQILSNHMFFGVGPENSGLVLRSQGLFGTLDNVFLTVVCEIGLFGFILFLTCWIAVFYRLRKVADTSYRTAGHLVILVSLLFGFSYNTAFYAAGWGTFWFVISVILKLGDVATPNPETTTTDSVNHGSANTVGTLSVALVATNLKEYPGGIRRLIP